MRTRGCRLLKRHIKDGWVSKKAFADASHISPTMLSHILSGRRRPTLDAAFTIAEASNGVVPASMWRECEREDGQRDASTSGG